MQAKGGPSPVTTGHYRWQIIALVDRVNGIWRLFHGIRVIPTARSGTWRVQTAAIRLHTPHYTPLTLARLQHAHVICVIGSRVAHWSARLMTLNVASKHKSKRCIICLRSHPQDYSCGHSAGLTISSLIPWQHHSSTSRKASLIFVQDTLS